MLELTDTARKELEAYFPDLLCQRLRRAAARIGSG